ncbi:GAF domain-containing protein [Salinivibrio sp. ES.052]|uniref:sensor domain-containing diguanylate cyclase n=1 Tax=Salinivibrio sp. ES.052 TaxID=1882823 RepID=UPI00092AC8F0|nr:GAF domain-containing protein [Salinivibrio sp. ES.052]SIN90749.1 GGDEF domain-containing protein, diguanylate cyclase (c-di-GMP synthetase) or its enzymatically inactive variants [Salinivibrio sp. ES.052]
MIHINTQDQIPFEHFEKASRDTLKYLNKKFGYGTWMMTRKHEDQWVILQVEGNKYGIDELTTLTWSDSMCSRMVKGEGPRWAPDVDNVPAYVNAPIYRAENIKSYIGIPVCYSNGNLFGTLCAIDTEPVDRIPSDGLETIELVSKLLSTLLQLELQNIALSRKQISFLPSQLKDNETGFLNRLGWSLYLEKEESNIRSVGTPVHVIALDISQPDKSTHSKDTAITALFVSILNGILHDNGYISRLGEDIYTMLCANRTEEQIAAMVERIAHELSEASIPVLVGFKKHRYGDSLDSTVITAIKSVRQSV